MPRRLLQDKLVQKLPKLGEYSERSIKTWSSMKQLQVLSELPICANTFCRTLYGMFPNLDKDVIDDVVRLKEGRWVIDTKT